MRLSYKSLKAEALLKCALSRKRYLKLLGLEMIKMEIAMTAMIWTVMKEIAVVMTRRIVMVM